MERKPWDLMEPSFFYEQFVKQRKPVVISTNRTAPGVLEALFGLRGEAAKWASSGSEGTAAMRSCLAGKCQVLGVSENKGPYFGGLTKRILLFGVPY